MSVTFWTRNSQVAYWILLPAILHTGWMATIAQAISYQEPVEKPSFRERAIQVSHWLDSMAVSNPNGPGIVWRISDQRPEHDWSLYSGSSGVLLFYLQLYRQTDDPHFLSQAEAGGEALISAFNRSNETTPAGFWVGLAGQAYALNELASVSQDDRFRTTADRIVDRLMESAIRRKANGRSLAKWSDVTDIISGNAGIGQFLLYASTQMERKDSLELAIEVADGLLQDAVEVHVDDPSNSIEQAQTRKWLMSPQFEREMPNYSHGTAGVADFLLSVRAALLESKHHDAGQRFEKAALDASAYLRKIAVVNDKSALIAHHYPGGDQLFYLGWCHGPAGTGRFLERVAEAELNHVHADMDRTIARLGVRVLLTSPMQGDRLEGLWNNVGLCCGTTGIATYLLNQERLFDSPENSERIHAQVIRIYEDLIHRAARVELMQNERKVIGLKWTHAEHRVRPDLLEAQTGIMQGAAGIGLWLLQLDAQQRNLDFPYQLPFDPLSHARMQSSSKQ